MLIILVPIFLFGVYDYCIYYSNIIDDLNNKSSMHQLYDILNQGVKVITNEHENEKIIFLILWVMGTFLHMNIYLIINLRNKYYGIIKAYRILS